MGYIAITSRCSDIEILKTSETLFVGHRYVYTFFELEVGPKQGNVFNRKDISLTIAIKGKVKKAHSARGIITKPSFLPWYYSQKKIVCKGPGMWLQMNDKDTKIVDCSVDVQYNINNGVSLCRLNLTYDPKPDEPVSSIHTFFTFISKEQVVSHRGSILSESRYFDRKLCPKGEYFENVVLQDPIVPIRRIYCWFVIPKTYIATDYTSFGSLYPRDARIAEQEYDVLLQNGSCLCRVWNWISTKLFGRPQIMNWVLGEEQITFNLNYKEIGKWDEIRIFVACSGFPLGTLFLYIAGIASIIGAIVTMIFMG